MTSKEIYFDAKNVKSIVQEEISMKRMTGIVPRPIDHNFLSLDLQCSTSDGPKKKKNYCDRNFSAPQLDQITAFKIQEDAKKLLELENIEDKRKTIIGTNVLLSQLPKCEIIKSQLYVMSPEEIKTKAVVNISSIVAEPGLNHGLFDKRMGSVSKNDICITCSRDDRGCGGHFGYIELPEKIVNPMFKKQCIWALQCICPYCGDTYIDEKMFKALKLHLIPKKKLLKIVAELSEKWLYLLHDHEGIAKIIYDKEFKGRTLSYTCGTDKKFNRSIANMSKIFQSVPDEKWKLIGFPGKTKPYNFITDVIPCAPPHIRTVSIVNDKKMDHPLTERYMNILKSIIKINQHTGGRVEKDNQLDCLYSAIESIAYGPEKKLGVKTPLKEAGILLGLGTKKGIIRGNMMGRRVDHCGRTVAGPAFESNMGEVLIPESGAKVLLVPIMVHQYNINQVIKDYREKKYIYMVMKLVSSKGMFTIGEKQIKEYTPRIGDVLLRHLKTGDRLLCGRQPSLHAESIQAFNAVVHEWDTIKIPNYMNHALNADFDGDELTYHILQTTMAMAEADTIMNSKYHIMNIQSNKPMMAMAFHALMAPFLATKFWIIKGVRKEITIPEKRWNEALSLLNDSYRKKSLDTRSRRNGIDMRSGRALFSVCLPTNFTYTGSGLTIIDGIITKGTMKKSNIGLKVLSLVQIICKMYSIKEACRFINDMQKISDWFIMWHGLSMGYKDFNCNRKEVVKMLKKDVNEMQIEYFNLGPRPKDEIPLFFYMRSLHTIVDKTRSNGKKIGEKFLPDNNILNILSEDKGCGAKGSLNNTSQITGSLGEQFIGANIPIPDLKGKTRCLPYYVSNDISLESIGYVIHSYMDGITPPASLFHEMASRITLIDTARNVSEIGYTHRRVEKSLEPIIINWLFLVVSSDGRLFQPIFSAGWDIGKSLEVSSKRTGKRIFFCNFEDEAKLLCRIHERKVLGITPENEELGLVKRRAKIIKADDEFHTFKKVNGRFPKFSELEEQ